MIITRCCICGIASTFIVLSLLLLMPLLYRFYPILRTIFYQESVCVIYEAVYTIQFACECGHGCKALYPCLLVNAFLNGTNDAQTDREWPIYVYEDDWQLVAVNTAEEQRREQCYSQTCNWNTNKNRDMIELIRQTLDRGTSLVCYFDPDNFKHGAFVKRNFSWLIAFHVIFWPGITFMAGSLLCLLNCCVKRRSSSMRAEYAIDRPLTAASKPAASKTSHPQHLLQKY